jgi:hypothetical protein
LNATTRRVLQINSRPGHTSRKQTESSGEMLNTEDSPALMRSMKVDPVIALRYQ